MIKDISHIIKHEMLLDYRQKFSFAGTVLFAIASVFIVEKVFQEIKVFSWNAIFWILFIFVSLNSMVRSYAKMTKKRYHYYYTLYNPIALSIAKIIYNTLNLFLLACVLYFFMSWFTIDPIVDKPLFFIALFLGSLGIGAMVSFVSILATKGENSHTLLAILSIPLLIPTVLLLLKITASASGILNDTSITTDFSFLLAIDLLSIGFSLILFPSLWRN